MRKHFFYNFRPAILASKIKRKIMLFQTPFLDIIFRILFGFVRKQPIWGPFKIQWAPKSARHRPVSGVVKPENVESGQNLSLMSQAGLLKIPILGGFSISACLKSDLFVILACLLPAPKNIKPSLPKSIKFSKIHTLDTQCFNFDDLLAPFAINFPDHLNLSNYSRYNTKTSFLPFQASHCGIKNQ